MACAHELLHYIQDYYYMQLFSKFTIKWWLEATAVQADRFVWPTNSKYEAIDYSANLYGNLTKSWDNCNSDPEYYIAGTFLSYLITYRTGTKLNLPELIVDGGKATDISFMRTIVDNSIKTKLGSPGIGAEFVNFIKLAYSGSSAIKLIPSSPTPSPVYPNFKNSILKTKNQKETLSATIPHLATAFFKGMNKTGEKQIIVAKIESKTEQLVALAYKINRDGSATYLQDMFANDSLKIELNDDKEWLEIVGINKDKDNDGTMAVNFKFDKQPLAKSFYISLGVICNYKRAYSSGSTDKGTNSYGFTLTLPCTQKGDTITASWNQMIDAAPHKGNAIFVIEKDKTLSFQIPDERNYSGTLTTSDARGSMLKTDTPPNSFNPNF